MPRFCLHAGRLHAEIDPDLGASLTDFSIDGPHSDRYPLLRRAPREAASPAQAGCFLLAPWPNRVRDARFTFAGRTHALRVNFPDGTAIHGEAWDRPWTITDRSPVHARLVFDSREHDTAFPWAFGAMFRAELTPTGLELDLSVTNLSDTPMPAGCGLHPYFPRRLFSEADAVTLRAPVSARYPARDCLPTGPAAAHPVCQTLGAGVTLTTPERSLELDDCFAGFSGRAEITWPASGVTLTMDCSPEFSHLVVFSPHRAGSPLPWFCVEPVTMANDGFNLSAEHPGAEFGLRTLDPGQTLATRTTLHVAIDR